MFGLLGVVIGGLLALVYESREDSGTAGVMPDLVLVPPARLQHGDCPKRATCLPRMAFYHADERRIYLSRNWSPDNFHDLGILLHEFVHHLQVIGKLEYPCSREIELPAYELQEAFYRLHGRDAAGRVPSDFTRLTRFSCLDE